MAKKKQPKTYSLGKDVEKKSKQTENPESYYAHNPMWRFSKRDGEHSKWKVSSEKIDESLLAKLSDFEKMTWSEILKTSGGRKQGNNHHFIEIDKLCSEAQKRIKELNILEDSLFSLRFTNKERLWGIVQGGVFYILWLDSNHEVYPVQKK